MKIVSFSLVPNTPFPHSPPSLPTLQLGDHRDTWAKNYAALLSADPTHVDNMRIIESAGLVVSFDAIAPSNPGMAKQSAHAAFAVGVLSAAMRPWR